MWGRCGQHREESPSAVGSNRRCRLFTDMISSSLRQNTSSRGRGHSRILPTPPRTTRAPCRLNALKSSRRQMEKGMVGSEPFLVSYVWMWAVACTASSTQGPLSPRSTGFRPSSNPSEWVLPQFHSRKFSASFVPYPISKTCHWSLAESPETMTSVFMGRRL